MDRTSTKKDKASSLDNYMAGLLRHMAQAEAMVLVSDNAKSSCFQVSLPQESEEELAHGAFKELQRSSSDSSLHRMKNKMRRQEDSSSPDKEWSNEEPSEHQPTTEQRGETQPERNGDHGQKLFSGHNDSFRIHERRVSRRGGIFIRSLRELLPRATFTGSSSSLTEIDEMGEDSSIDAFTKSENQKQHSRRSNNGMSTRKPFGSRSTPLFPTTTTPLKNLFQRKKRTGFPTLANDTAVNGADQREGELDELNAVLDSAIQCVDG